MSRVCCYWGFLTFSTCSSWFWEMRKDPILIPWWWYSFLLLLVFRMLLMNSVDYSLGSSGQLENCSSPWLSPPTTSPTMQAFAASPRTTAIVAVSTVVAFHAGNPIWVSVMLGCFIKHPWNQTPSLVPVVEIQHPQMTGYPSSLEPEAKNRHPISETIQSNCSPCT